MKEEKIFEILTKISNKEIEGQNHINKTNRHQLKSLHKNYIICQISGDGCLIKGIYLLDKGKEFLENYDNSKSKKLDTYLGKYPNISKLMYLIIGFIVGLIPFILKIIF